MADKIVLRYNAWDYTKLALRSAVAVGMFWHYGPVWAVYALLAAVLFFFGFSMEMRWYPEQWEEVKALSEQVERDIPAPVQPLARVTLVFGAPMSVLEYVADCVRGRGGLLAGALWSYRDLIRKAGGSVD